MPNKTPIRPFLEFPKNTEILKISDEPVCSQPFGNLFSCSLYIWILENTLCFTIFLKYFSGKWWYGWNFNILLKSLQNPFSFNSIIQVVDFIIHTSKHQFIRRIYHLFGLLTVRCSFNSLKEGTSFQISWKFVLNLKDFLYSSCQEWKSKIFRTLD